MDPAGELAAGPRAILELFMGPFQAGGTGLLVGHRQKAFYLKHFHIEHSVSFLSFVAAMPPHHGYGLRTVKNQYTIVPEFQQEKPGETKFSRPRETRFSAGSSRAGTR